MAEDDARQSLPTPIQEPLSVPDKEKESLAGSVVPPGNDSGMKQSIVFHQQTNVYPVLPFPSSSEMEGYVSMGVADRIIDYIFQEAQHRRQCDEKLISHSIQMEQQTMALQKEAMFQANRSKTRGQWSALTIVLIVMGIAAYVATYQPWVASLIVGFTLVVIVGTFITNDFSWKVMKWLPFSQTAKKKESETSSEQPNSPHE